MTRKRLKIILIVGLVIIIILTGVLVGLIIKKKKDKETLNAQIKAQQEQEALAEEVENTDINLEIEELEDHKVRRSGREERVRYR